MMLQEIPGLPYPNANAPNDLKVFIEYLNDMDDIYEDINEENPNNKCKMLILFDDMIPDFLNNKKFDPIVTNLFI